MVSAGLSATVKGRFEFNGKLRHSGEVISAAELGEVREKNGPGSIEALKSQNLIEMSEGGQAFDTRSHAAHAARIDAQHDRITKLEALVKDQGEMLELLSADIAKLKSGSKK